MSVFDLHCPLTLSPTGLPCSSLGLLGRAVLYLSQTMFFEPSEPSYSKLPGCP